MLQEEVQKYGGKVTYRVISETGPDHHKDFVVEALVNDKKKAIGKGMSKKDAEQDAAKNALAGMGYEIL